MIAGQILARAAGRPVAAAMRQELFAHPGGDGLAFQPAERPRPPLAHAYWHPDGTPDRVDANDGSRLLPFRGDATMAFTAGALAGDVPSLARWSHDLLSGRILKPASLRAMTQFHNGALWRGYGLGLARDRAPDRKHELWGHGGEVTGSNTELWHLPSEQLTIAIAWNDDSPSGAAAELLPALLRAALGSKP